MRSGSVSGCFLAVSGCFLAVFWRFLVVFWLFSGGFWRFLVVFWLFSGGFWLFSGCLLVGGLIRTREGKGQPEPIAAAFQFPHRRWVADFPTLPGNLKDASAPRLYQSRARERVRDAWVVRSRSQRPRLLFPNPVGREVRRVENHNAVVVHSDLDRGGACVVPMDDCVGDRLPHGCTRHGECLDPVDAVIGDQAASILRVQQVHGTVDLREQVALDEVLKQHFGLPKVPDLHNRPHERSLGRRMEEQCRRPLQKLGFPQLKLFDNVFIGLVQNGGWQPATFDPVAAEFAEDVGVEAPKRNAWNRHVVPGSAVASEQKPTQRSAAQHLLRATASVVELALVADRVGVAGDGDTQVFAIVVVHDEVYVDDDAEERLHLVGDFLEQPKDAVHPDDGSLVVLADFEGAALGVGESADPLDVLVAPRPLPLDVLGFRRHGVV